MKTYEKGNQVYRVAEGGALEAQLLASGFVEVESKKDKTSSPETDKEGGE